jgi:hypothetical protein
MMTPNQPHIPYPLLKASTIAAMERTDLFILSILKQSATPSPWDKPRACTTLVSIWCGFRLGTIRHSTICTRAKKSLSTSCAGCGLAEIGEDTVEIGPGDFMGFAPGRFPHNLINNSTDDLVYLVGGLNLDFDICDYPRVGQRLYRRHEQREYVLVSFLNFWHISACSSVGRIGQRRTKTTKSEEIFRFLNKVKLSV